MDAAVATETAQARRGRGMTAPLTPADCDLRDFSRMMIDIPRLRGSDFDATPDDAAWRAGVNLWLTAWHQVPAASLSNDDASLAKAAGLGRDLRTWRKVRGAALRSWVLCDDGRLYHPTVAELALEGWIEKLRQRLKSGAGNERRWGVTFDSAHLETALARTVGLLAELNPASKAIAKASFKDALRIPQGQKNDPTGREIPSHKDAKTVPEHSQEKGEETGTGILEEPKPNGLGERTPAAAPPAKGSRLPSDWVPSEIDRAYAVKQGFSAPAVERIAEKFRNYWTAKTGKAATKLDWSATWRNWVIEEAERRGVKPDQPQRIGFV